MVLPLWASAVITRIPCDTACCGLNTYCEISVQVKCSVSFGKWKFPFKAPQNSAAATRLHQTCALHWDKISAFKSKTSRLGSSTLMTPIWSQRKAHLDLLPPRFICKAVRRGHSETGCMLNSHLPHYSELGGASAHHEWMEYGVEVHLLPLLCCTCFQIFLPAAERCSHKWAVLQLAVCEESFICCPGCLND